MEYPHQRDRSVFMPLPVAWLAINHPGSNPNWAVGEGCFIFHIMSSSLIMSEHVHKGARKTRIIIIIIVWRSHLAYCVYKVGHKTAPFSISLPGSCQRHWTEWQKVNIKYFKDVLSKLKVWSFQSGVYRFSWFGAIPRSIIYIYIYIYIYMGASVAYR